MLLRKSYLTFCAIFLISGLLSAQTYQKPEEFKPMADSIKQYLLPKAAMKVPVAVDSVVVTENSVEVHFNRYLADYALRDNTVKELNQIASLLLPQQYKGKKVTLHSANSSIEELASEFYSEKYNASLAAQNKKKKSKSKKGQEQPVRLVTNMSRPYQIENGLDGKHIAMWQSHGWYYDQPLMRWEWQRARIFETVEDLYTQSYVVPFLVPMLENAGANVLLPRERDYSTKEYIVDNDKPMKGYTESNGDYEWVSGTGEGFANPKKSYVHGENPFTMGTFRQVNGVVKTKKHTPVESVAKWIPDIHFLQELAVYVSYKTIENSTDAAYYTVKYKGGSCQFKVNQQMGGGTWIYLGTFPFSHNQEEQGVYLSNLTDKPGTVITADGVKFGGGEGNIARNPHPDNQKFTVEALTSGYPRFTEGARYWLQWAGFADTVYSYTNNKNDYTDDYMSRGRWVNTISGGSKMNPEYKGLNIPVDLSFAFHTDAGTFLNDSIVGTLAIYTRYSNGSDKFPTGKSRLVNREYTDIVQTQIVDDIRATYHKNWSRRGLWDRSYNESRTPNVPSMLLELLSHQNFADMRFGLDPSFRFVVSRAIYKGMVRFLSKENGGKYTIQPLPVKNFAVILENGKVRLSWSPREDKLEPTATPSAYVIYTKKGNDGYDNGIVVKDTTALLDITNDVVHTYKVVAINDGGASFPSEELSAGIVSGIDGKVAMVVNGFNRVSAPAIFSKVDSTFAGFNNEYDNGVPYMKDASFIGSQYEFRRDLPWRDDDASGFGASNANYEKVAFNGNTFNYAQIHGLALMKCGYSFVSSSTGAITAGKATMNGYDIVDIIMGQQAQTKVGREDNPVKYEVFPAELRNAIAEYCNNGGNIVISGTNVATDLYESYNVTNEGKEFAENVLKFKWMTHYASVKGNAYVTVNPYGFKAVRNDYSYTTELGSNIQGYAAKNVDALVPSSSDSYTILRYSENNLSAAVAYKGAYKSVVVGFPIETMYNYDLNKFMQELVKFFESK